MNEEFEIKKKIAVAILAKTRISKRDYLPPFYIFLWRLGIKIPPPHFIKSQYLLIIAGLPFGFCWLGIAMMDKYWFLNNIEIVISTFLIITAVAGGAIAIFYRISSKTNKLPKWENLKT
jgi:hypothetical protein